MNLVVSPSKRVAAVTLFIAAVLWGFFGYFAAQIEKRGDATVLLAGDDSQVVLKQEMEKIFGSPNFVIVSLPKEASFSQDGIRALQQAHLLLESFEEVKQVHSIFSTQYIESGSAGFDVSKIAPAQIVSVDDIETIRRRLEENPTYAGTVTSLDRGKLAMVVEFSPTVLDPDKLTIVNNVLDGLDIAKDWHVSGLPVVNSEIVSLIDRDLMLLFPGFTLLLILVLYAAFRSVLGIVLPLSVVMFGITVTLGLMSLFDVPLNVVSNNIPMLLTCIGGAYCIHFLNQYQHEALTGNSEERIQRTLKHITPTIFLAALTTVLGFLANSTSTVAAVREFGYFMAIGLVILFLATNVLLPSILSFFPLKASANSDLHSEAKVLPFWLHFLERYRLAILAIAGVVGITSLYAASILKAEYRTLGYFKSDSEIVEQAREVSQNFGGFSSFDIIIDTKKPEGVVDPHLLQTMDDFSAWVKSKYPEDVQVSVNFADFVKEMSKAFNGEEKYHRIPSNPDEIFQYLDVYSWSAELTEDFRNFLSPDWSKVRLTGRLSILEQPDGSYQERPVQYHAQLIEEGISWLRSRLGESVDIYAFGEVPIWAKVNDEIIEGQFMSVIIAIVFVWLVTWLIFRSLVLSLLCLIPVTLAVSVNFIAMATFGINLDIATTLVSSMAIGIGIDDTIHFMLTYREHQGRGLSHGMAIRETLRTSGRAIIYTSVALVAGFLVFLFSSFKPVIYFGALNALTIFVATVATLCVLPAALLVRKSYGVLKR